MWVNVNLQSWFKQFSEFVREILLLEPPLSRLWKWGYVDEYISTEQKLISFLEIKKPPHTIAQICSSEFFLVKAHQLFLPLLRSGEIVKQHEQGSY